MVLRGGHAVPAALDETLIGLGEAVRRHNYAVFKPRALQVTGAVERRQDLAAETSGFFQHGAHQVLAHPIESG